MALYPSLISMHSEVMMVQIGRDAAYGTINVDCDKFPPHVNEFIYDYGLRQILNDAVSQKEDKKGNRLTNAEIFAKAQRKYEQLLSGELRAQRGTSGDPVEDMAWSLAKTEITAYLTSKGAWPKGGKGKLQTAINTRMAQLKKKPMAEDDYIEAWLVQRPSLMDDAKAEVAKRAAAKAKAAAAAKTITDDAGL